VPADGGVRARAWVAITSTDTRWFVARWSDPRAWAVEPLAVRLATPSQARPLLNSLMLHGHLQPGYDYLLERKLSALPCRGLAQPAGWGPGQVVQAAGELGHGVRARTGMASQVAARLLIQTGRTLAELTESDLAVFAAAIDERDTRHDRELKHYRTAVYASGSCSTTSAARSNRR
jgi:hypothetical protein